MKEKTEKAADHLQLNRNGQDSLHSVDSRRGELSCARCGNRDPSLFGFDHGIRYCRKCISFGRLEAGMKPVSRMRRARVIRVKPKLRFELTPYQKEISEKACRILLEGKDVFIYAAAGAGKTEITLESICWYLKEGKRVGFAISRRQVVLEIADRLQAYFPGLKITPVCEGFPENPADRYDSDLIICTMHQLYRYPKTFDLLIMDEVDAFPFAGNEMLIRIADEACRGQKMMLSATPDTAVFEAVRAGSMEICELFRRPHGKALCDPGFIRASRIRSVLLILLQCRKLVRAGKQVLVFIPRKADGWWMKAFLKLAGRTDLIHSQSEDRDSVMDRFRRKEIDVLVCTTLLERGITVPSVQVLVYRADHPVFTCASLVQIFGRIGRTFQDPFGIGLCYCLKPSGAMKEARAIIRQMNRDADGA